MSAAMTPGPWTAGPEQNMAVMITAGVEPIAMVDAVFERGHANARAIAAVPDLIAALSSNLELLLSLHGAVYRADSRAGARLKIGIDTARAALAKAGQS